MKVALGETVAAGKMVDADYTAFNAGVMKRTRAMTNARACSSLCRCFERTASCVGHDLIEIQHGDVALGTGHRNYGW